MTAEERATIMSASTGTIDLTAVRRVRRAIVFADLVESVRLFREHEAEAIERWRRYAAQVRDRLLSPWGGRLVRTAGDGFLIECERGASAVGLALAMHEALQAENEDRPASEAMLLRVGVHVGEVLFDQFEAYGSGVNLAQRLSMLAAPGGTVISPPVRDDLADGLQCQVVDLGMRYVKHLPEPVRAFSVRPLADAEAGRQARLGPAEDLRPTIAVVPFQAMPADPEHDALGHAMADDIIATLSRHPGMKVLSRLTTAAVREVAGDWSLLRQTLGASFVLSGRFYVRNGRVRLAAELCELRQGQVLWTASHQADVDALFEGQDDLVPQLVQQVTQQVLAHELVRVRSLPMDTLASYSLLLGAAGLLNSLVPTDFEHARSVLEHLVERHPRQATLHAMLSEWHVLRMVQGWTADPARESEGAWAHAQRAMDLDPMAPDALLADSSARIVKFGDFAGAETSCLQALSINPQLPMAWAQRSETQRAAGDPVAALASAEHALALSPLDPQRYMIESFAASAAYEAQRYGDAQRHAQASLRRHVLHAPPHLVLIAALWNDGQHEAARVAAAECRRHLPELRVGRRITAKPGTASMESPFARALLDAGLPP